MVPEILIVGEDERRTDLETRIARLGYGTAGCPLDAVGARVAEGPSPAAIVLCSTGTDAASLMASLRRTPQGAAVPVTLYGRLGGQIRDLADVLDLGADHFLEEPAHDDQLLNVLEALAGPPAEAQEPGPRQQGPASHERSHPVVEPLHRTLDRVGSNGSTATPEPSSSDDPDELELGPLDLPQVPDVSDETHETGDEFPELPEFASEPKDARAPSSTPSSAPEPDSHESTTVLAPAREPMSERESTTVLAREQGTRPSSIATDTPRALHQVSGLEGVFELEGIVRRGLVMRMLWQLGRAGYTGAVSFERERAHKRVWLREGAIMFARSNVSADRLIAYLYRSGKLSERQYETARRLAAREPRRAGQLLVEAGFIIPGELPTLLRQQLARIVDSMFSWESGRYALEPGEPCDESILMTDSLLRIIAEGVRLRLQPAQLWSLLGSAEQFPLLRTTAHPCRAMLVHELALSELAQGLWDRLDGTRPLQALVADEPAAEAELLALVYTLVLCGQCELLGEAVPKSPTTAAEIDRERVLERLRLAREGDYFALLGVERDDDALRIDQAYAMLCETFADDALDPDIRDDLAVELDELRAVLAQAVALLRDDFVRAAYRGYLEASS